MAIYKNLPVFYRPTNVLLLDDDRKLLNSLSDLIDPVFPYILRENPAKALHYLQTHTYNTHSLSKKLFHRDYDTMSESDIDEKIGFHLKTLSADLHSPEPYKRAVVALVDHMMEGMTGLKFCHHVRELGLPIQLVLLTGVATPQEAIDALNHGIIDAYISKEELKKGDQKINQTINNIIKMLAWKQFQHMSQALLGSVLSQSSVLDDEHFQEIFKKILEQQDICEFYMTDMSCSYLLIHPSGKVKFLMVRSLSDFDTLYDVAKDSHAPHHVLQFIRDKQRYPFRRIDELLPMLEGDDWEDVMKQVDKVPGRDIFYAVLDCPHPPEIFSFNRYVNEVWPAP